MNVRATSPPMEWQMKWTGASSGNHARMRSSSEAAESLKSRRQSNQNVCTFQFSESERMSSP